MSDTELTMLDGTEIRYTYGNEEFILESNEADNEQLQNIICPDGSRAILINGQYYVADDQHTILLQEEDSNLTQFYINENSESFVCDDGATANLPSTNEYVQLVEEGAEDPQQVLYYTDETEPQEGLIQDEEGNLYPFKRVKVEDQVWEMEDPNASQESSDTIEYTIINEEEEEEEEKVVEPPKQNLDLGKITGKNLITGQTVTLHSYVEKLRKKLKSDSLAKFCRKEPVKKLYGDEVRKPELRHLIDKTISIGKTSNGKKIVGKIISVKKKESLDQAPEEEQVSSCEETEDPPVREEPEKRTKILLRKSSVSRDTFDQISKTLGGVMEMETVRKKLENKNIVVKLVEKRYSEKNDSFNKSVCYSYGFMEKEISNNVDKWKFVADQTTQDAILAETEEKAPPEKSTVFSTTTSLTILLTYQKGGKRTIKVNLNPAPGNVCNICAQVFRNNFELRFHMDAAHNTYGKHSHCEVCNEQCADVNALNEHRLLHISEGRLFVCSYCNRCFSTAQRLQRHLPTHDVQQRPLECAVCSLRCSSRWAMKKHLLTHTGLKPFICDVCQKQFASQYDLTFHRKMHFPEKLFSCEVCMRSFSRHGNLVRHLEIHKGNGQLYKCEICYCSYNYVSSLTRHMVQNHIDAADFQKTPLKVPT